MDDRHPKRRKDKYNPYTISKRDGRYYLAFTDGQGVFHDMEIAEQLYYTLDRFELDDLSWLNEWDRHIEQSELTDEALHQRAVTQTESVEDSVIRRMLYRQLHKAIAALPETQRRRLLYYYFAGMTYEQIAELEGCTFQAVGKSIAAAEKNIKKFLE